jgi:hypothetical protein
VLPDDGMFSNQKFPIGVNFVGSCNGKRCFVILYDHVVHFTAVCYILWPFGILWLFGVFSRLGRYVVPRKIWKLWSSPPPPKSGNDCKHLSPLVEFYSYNSTCIILQALLTQPQNKCLQLFDYIIKFIHNGHCYVSYMKHVLLTILYV